MGQNLIMNIADHKFTIVAFNRTVAKVDRFLDNEAKGLSMSLPRSLVLTEIAKLPSEFPNIVGAHSMEEFVLKLKKPRRIMMLVMAGKPVDDFINALLPFVEKETSSLTAVTHISRIPHAEQKPWPRRASDSWARAFPAEKKVHATDLVSCPAVTRKHGHTSRKYSNPLLQRVMASPAVTGSAMRAPVITSRWSTMVSNTVTCN